MRGPLLRFAVLGSLLFALDLARAPAAAPPPLGAARDDDALLVAEAMRRGLHTSDDVVRRRLAQNLRFARPDDARSDGDLVDEALKLGMHESDLVVKRRLALRMRLLFAEAARESEPSEAELEAYLSAHAARYTEPERVAVTQLYYAEAARAAAAHGALRAGQEARPAPDALPIPRELPPLSEAELAARLGPRLAAAALAGPDAAWLGPIASPYGHHLVRVRSRTPARLSPLASVRGEVREALLAERAEAAVAAGIASLRRP